MRVGHLFQALRQHDVYTPEDMRNLENSFFCEGAFVFDVRGAANEDKEKRGQRFKEYGYEEVGKLEFVETGLCHDFAFVLVVNNLILLFL